MTFELKLIRLKKFLLLVLLSIPLVIGGVISISVLFNSKGILFLAIPLLIIIFVLAQRKTGKKSKIILEADKLVLENRTINLKEVYGYFIDENVSMAAMNIKLKTQEIIRFTISTTRDNKQNYQEFINHFLKTLLDTNPNIVELKFQDVHTRQMKLLGPIIYLMIFVVLIIDVMALLSFISGGNKFIYQLLYTNALLVGVVPYLIKRKTNANTK
jgi:hypothetical protein